MKDKDLVRLINEMKSFSTNLKDVFYLDTREIDMLLTYIRELEETNNIYGYFLAIISSNCKRFRKYSNGKYYRLNDFNLYDKYMEENDE